jgi:peptidoglycan hydrolase CwlO-like protein
METLQKELALKQNIFDQHKEEKSGLQAQVSLLEHQVGTEQQRATDLKVRFPFISHQIIALTKFLSYAFFPHR